jgi:S-DNA-T family DNA segregation ATPase FtsK/SpoIIIE
MATTRPGSTGPSLAPYALAGAVVVAAVAVWFGYPGLIALPIGLGVAGFLAPPAILTGKKNASGFPTAANPAEDKAMNTYRMWSELKVRAFIPSADWLPGWPIRLWWVASILLSIAAFAIPVGNLPAWWRLGDSVALFTAVNTFNGALRRWTAPDDLCPGPTVKDVITQFGQGPKVIIAGSIGGALAVAAFLVTVIGLDKLGLTIQPMAPWMLALTIALTLVVISVTIAVRAESLAAWRTLVRVRAEWIPRWLIVKVDPAPRLISHEELGSIQIDTFESHPSIGASAIASFTKTLSSSIGASVRLALLESPNVDSQGQPIEGTVHPLRFRLVTFNSDDLPDLTDLSLDQMTADIMMAASFSWASDMNGYGRWVFLGSEPLHNPENAAGGTAAWAAYFAQPNGPSPDEWRKVVGTVEDAAGVEVRINHRTNVTYFGSLSAGTTKFADPTVEKKIRDTILEDEWSQRWSNVLKMGAVQPRPEHAVFSEAKVGNSTLYNQPFIVQQGIDPMMFQKEEPKLSTTLSAAEFVAVTGYPAVGTKRGGDRHPQAFSVIWSKERDSIPANPDTLPPMEGKGPQWVLSGRMNEAFDAARLARPEVASVRCLTDPKSRGHIWAINLRLYGGVTLADVRLASQKLRQALGSGWLRVQQTPDGCVVVVGVAPNFRGIKFAGAPTNRNGVRGRGNRPDAPGAPRDTAEEDAKAEKANRDFVTSLDWEQAFSDSKVIGSGGVLPKLTRTGVLPTNTRVQVLDFTLPPGTDRALIKAALPKLQAATSNDYIEVRPSADGANSVRLYVCEDSPLPSMAAVDWAVAYEAVGKLPFATGVEGEPVMFDPTIDPHILVAGTSGGGKSVALQLLLYSAVLHHCEVYVIDPTKAGADFQFAYPYAKAFASTVSEAAAVMKAIYAEVSRRRDLNAKHKVGSYRQLPDDIRPKHIYVFMDEFTSLMQTDPVSKVESDDPEVERERELSILGNQSKLYIGTMAGKIAREARSAGVTLVLATQKLSAVMLDGIPGANDLKTNLARMLVGSATFGEMQSALRNPSEAPPLGDVIPRGRGRWESTGGNAQVIQVWFEPEQSTFAAKLAEECTPLIGSERLDLAPFMAKTRDSEPVQQKTVQPVSAPEEVTIAEFEFSLDDLDLDDEPGTTPALELEAAPEPIEQPEEMTMPETEPTPPSNVIEPEFLAPAAALLLAPELPPAPTPMRTVIFTGVGVNASAEGFAEMGELVSLPPTSEDAGQYGWSKIAFAVDYVTSRGTIDDVIWLDAEVMDDVIGLPYNDIIEDVFADMGVTIRCALPTPGTLPPSVPASPSLPVLLAAPAPIPSSQLSLVPAASAPPLAASQVSKPARKPKAVLMTADQSTFDEPSSSNSAGSVFDDLFA